jgi:hypothetical protein
MARREPSGTGPRTAESPALEELVERAAALVKRFPECFWFWHPDARIRTGDDVRLVVRHLREYGDREAWLAAQDLNQCLSPQHAAEGNLVDID